MTTPIKLGPEFLINTTTAEMQERPSVSALADGGFVVTWQSYYQDGSEEGIYGQRYDNLGATVGSEFLINSTTLNNQIRPSITALDDGSFMVTWLSYDLCGGDVEIYGQRYKAQLFGSSNDDTISGTVGSNWMDGRGGADKLFGGGGSDTLKGGGGKDVLKGGSGADVLKGGTGNDKLSGNKGNDKLTGNGGKDKFIFKKFDGKDTITDFTDGQDKIDLSGLGFADKAAALAKFYEIGSGSNEKLGFDHKGTTIIVKGIDMGDLSGADIII